MLDEDDLKGIGEAAEFVRKMADVDTNSIRSARGWRKWIYPFFIVTAALAVLIAYIILV